MLMNWALVGLGLFPLYPFLMNRSSLRSLSVNSVSCLPFHQGQAGTLRVRVENQSPRFLGDVTVYAYDASHTCDVPGVGAATVPLVLEKHDRGVFPLPALTLKTTFPFSLFQASKKIVPAGDYVVYPAIEPGAPSWPEVALSPRRADRQGEEVVAFREHQHGDAMNTVDWKVSARAQKIVVRQFESPTRKSMIFSFRQVEHLGLEGALSRLATWIVRAHAEGIEYGLDLEGEVLCAHHSPEHRHACLVALARFRQEKLP